MRKLLIRVSGNAHYLVIPANNELSDTCDRLGRGDMDDMACMLIHRTLANAGIAVAPVIGWSEVYDNTSTGIISATIQL